MGTGSEGIRVTMVLRGTVPLTSDTVAAAGAAAAGAAGSCDPQAAASDDAMTAIRNGVRTEAKW